ncbi:MAG: SRPBCC family protein [Pseudomonadales bacterium]|nr:SRPBCC family protein [Pseudomonadales bacterium]
MEDRIDSVVNSVEVNLSIEKAFEKFTKEFNSWWPKEYTWSQQKLEKIELGLESGARCTEFGPDGFVIDWGKVIEWNPSTYLAIRWQIGATREPQPDPEKSSLVEVQFKSLGSEKARVTLEHKKFENHGEGAAEYRDNMASEFGWPYVLAQYQNTVNA